MLSFSIALAVNRSSFVRHTLPLARTLSRHALDRQPCPRRNLIQRHRNPQETNDAPAQEPRQLHRQCNRKQRAAGLMRHVKLRLREPQSQSGGLRRREIKATRAHRFRRRFNRQKHRAHSAAGVAG